MLYVIEKEILSTFKCILGFLAHIIQCSESKVVSDLVKSSQKVKILALGEYNGIPILFSKYTTLTLSTFPYEHTF